MLTIILLPIICGLINLVILNNERRKFVSIWRDKKLTTQQKHNVVGSAGNMLFTKRSDYGSDMAFMIIVATLLPYINIFVTVTIIIHLCGHGFEKIQHSFEESISDHED